MARIRSIKPELWAHEGLARCSRDARLLFIGLFGVADDEGRMRASPVFLHGQVFPYDEDLDISPLLEELESGDHIRRYASEDGQRFLFIPSFLEHQRVDHASKSKLPAPPRELLAKSSRAPRETLAPDQGAGSREQGEEKGLVDESEEAPIPATGPTLFLAGRVVSSDTRRVFEYWVEVMGKNAGAKFSPERRRKVEQRLRDGYTVEQLCAAIDGCKASPHHAGQNAEGRVYDDLSLICRDATHVDQFLSPARARPGPKAAPSQSKFLIDEPPTVPGVEETAARMAKERAEFEADRKLHPVRTPEQMAEFRRISAGGRP